MGSKSSHTTTDHDEIRQWVEERGGFPATVETTEEGDEAGVLRIDFPGYSSGKSLRRISWDEFFRKFDQADLAFIYQDHTSEGEISRFSKFVKRETADIR